MTEIQLHVLHKGIFMWQNMSLDYMVPYCFHSQHWTGPILPHNQQPWPEERGAHTAYSMWDPDSKPANPCMVMVGGENRQNEPLGDVWLFYINTIQWEEVSECAGIF